MKLEEIRQLVEYFEDKILINFEKHFNSLVLEDFYTGGFEERINDEFFYEEYYSKYEQQIINLLLDIENETSSDIYDLKLRLIKLKRLIDTRLSNVAIKTDEKPLRTTRKRQFIVNSNINKEKFIKTLYNQLIHYKLIDIIFEDFEIHFGNDWVNRIQWLGTELQITNLITLLIENKYLTTETKRFKHKLITSHFTNKKGETFKENQLSSVFAENKSKTFEDITNDILDEMSNQF